MSLEQELDRFRDQGFLVVDDMVEPPVLNKLEAGGRRIRNKIRTGEVDIKTAFGANNEPSVIWGLLAPEYGEPIFADHLISEPIASYARVFLGEEIRLGGVALFTTANQVPYDTGWHRDLGGADKDASEAEELALLNRPKTVLKYMTDGMLLREAMADPLLERCARARSPSPKTWTPPTPTPRPSRRR